jgi:hypothetical protein
MNFLQPLRNFPGQARFKIQQQFVGQAKDIQVAFHFAFGGGDGGIAAFAHAEFFHVIRHLPVQKARAVGADEGKGASENSSPSRPRFRAKRGVFGEPVAIIATISAPFSFREPRARPWMKFVANGIELRRARFYW